MQDSLCMCDTIEVTATRPFAKCPSGVLAAAGEPQSEGGGIDGGRRYGRSVFTRVANLPPCHHPALACILILQPLSCAIVLSHQRGFSPKFTLWERPKLPKAGRGTAAAGIASGDSTSGIGMDHRRGKFTGFVPRISLWWHVRGLCARWSWNLSQYLLLLQNECVPHDCPRVRLVF